MTNPTAVSFPRSRARVIGTVYFFYFLAAIFAVFLAKRLVVSGDGAATAANLLAYGLACRSSCAVGLLANVFYVALTALFYEFFNPVNRSLSLLAAFFSLLGCAVQTFGGVFQLAPLVVLGGGQSLGAFKVEELQALALLFLKLHAQTFSIGLVFFACYDLVLGYLIFRSGFLPRFLGVFMGVAGLGWLCFLWPPLAMVLSRYVQPVGFLAELFLMLWLLVMRVDVHRPDRNGGD